MTNKFCEQNPFACDNNGSNRLIYDDCYYKQYIHGSVSPFVYNMYEGKFENCGKCRKDKFYHIYDLVDVESELRNQTRPMSACGGWKYNPNTKQPACQTFKSQPVKFESPNRRYIYNDNPTEKLVSHYFRDYQPNMQYSINKVNPQNNIIINKSNEEKLPYLKPENKNIERIIEENPINNKDIEQNEKDVVVENNNTQIENFKSIHNRKMPKKERFAPVNNPMINYPSKCMNSDTCRCNLRGFSTFDESVPVVYPPEICPIVFNNIKKPNGPGYFIPEYI